MYMFPPPDVYIYIYCKVVNSILKTIYNKYVHSLGFLGNTKGYIV